MRIEACFAVASILGGCASTHGTIVDRCVEITESAPPECVDSPAVDEFEDVLAEELARRLRWEHPPELIVRVLLDDASVVESACIGSATAAPGWSVRERVARAVPALREAGPGPSCLADSSLDLTGRLVERSARRAPSGFPQSRLSSCVGLRNVICTDSNSPVCGVMADGSRRTYSNACEACGSSFVAGYLDGACRP